jgi:hypothetical protein
MEVMMATQKTPGKNGFKYRENTAIVICEGAKAQETLFNRLKKLGFEKLKVVTV